MTSGADNYSNAIRNSTVFNQIKNGMTAHYSARIAVEVNSPFPKDAAIGHLNSTQTNYTL